MNSYTSICTKEDAIIVVSFLAFVSTYSSADLAKELDKAVVDISAHPATHFELTSTSKKFTWKPVEEQTKSFSA